MLASLTAGKSVIRCFFHIHTGALTLGAINGPRVTREDVKFNTTLEREIVFHDGSAVVILPAGTTGAYVARAKPASGAPTGALRIWDVEWEAPTFEGNGYIFRVPLWGSNLEAVEQNSQRGGERLLAAAVYLSLPTRRIESQTFEIAVAPAIWTDPPGEDPEAPYPSPAAVLSSTRNIVTVPLLANADNVEVDLMSLGLADPPAGILASVATRGAVVMASPDLLTLTESGVTVRLSAAPGVGAQLTLLIIP